jgi:hypothetical protein
MPNDLYRKQGDPPFKPMISSGPDPLGGKLKEKTESTARATADRITRSSSIARSNPMKGSK